MDFFSKKDRDEAHPYIPELKELYRGGRISRREFLRNATLLGMSAAAAGTFLAGCAPDEPAPTEAAVMEEETMEEETMEEEAAEEETMTGPMRGGVLRVGTQIQKVTHPAQFSWIMPTNIIRQVAEYLTYTDGNNITHPYLLKNWEASEDLKTWTLNLNQGVMHNNGDEFNADDVVFSISQWLDDDVGSSTKGLMAYLPPDGIEKVDDYTVRLNLTRAEIAVPEHLFHYPNMILNHRTFEGDFIKAPHGTGPYTLEEYSEGEFARVVARDDYWQTGADGQSLPYLDGMEFIDMGEELSAWIAAIQAGEVDYLDLGDSNPVEAYQALKDNPDLNVVGVPTGQTRVLRMRVDMAPWDDERVRMALKLCQNHEKILNLAYFGEGLLGQDFHVAQIHPEYCEKPDPAYDPVRAKELLADAGYPDGLDVELAVGSGWPDIVSYGEILKEDAAAGGFNITLNTMPNSQYWEQWTEVALGVTPWTHRPLGTMVLNLAYIADAEGNPAAWNETRWIDDEFSELLFEANGTLDVEKRREIFCKLEQIQYDRGPVGIPFWRNVWFVSSTKVKDVPTHPTYYMLFNEVWMES
jgi:peptide/nickel transport system substrate-binding protein